MCSGSILNVVLEENGEDKESEKVTNEEVIEHVGQKRTLLNNTLHRKANWVGHVLRRNYFIYYLIEGQMTEVNGVGRIRTQLLDDLINRRYWEQKGEDEDRKKMESTVYQSNIQ